MIAPTLATCTACGNTYPLADFPTRKCGDGVRRPRKQCRECFRAINLEAQRKHKAKVHAGTHTKQCECGNTFTVLSMADHYYGCPTCNKVTEQWTRDLEWRAVCQRMGAVQP